MEINTEINKVFGEQMATLFASKISEEELESKSNAAWKELNERPFSYTRDAKTELEKLIREQIVKRVLAKVEELLSKPVPEEKIKQEAERIITEAKEKAHKLLVDGIAENIKENTLNGSITYAINNACGAITSAIVELQRR